MSKFIKEKISSIGKNKIHLIVLALLLLPILAGCVQIKTSPQVTGGELGIHKTVDASANWQAKNALSNAEGKPLAISDTSVNRIIMDPSDNNALYLATQQGMFYSYDAADSWQYVDFFDGSVINDIAINYFDKCNVFMVAGQSIYRSKDCMRTWQEVYFDSRADLQITDVETEHYNGNIVYAGTSKGEVLKSTNFGDTWQTIKRIDNPIKQILIDKDDTRIIYIATETAGLFKTTDAGKTWSNDKPETDINKGLNDFYDGKVYRYLIQDMTKKNTLVLASQYGLLKTTDGGTTWQSIELITPERGANIYSLAIDPKDDKIIYYGTDTTLYKSTDGGKNWSTQKSPTGGVINFLLIDPKETNIIYLGAAIKK